jgi:hypothetical protein
VIGKLIDLGSFAAAIGGVLYSASQLFLWAASLMSAV